jgi:hypothetical protein
MTSANTHGIHEPAVHIRVGPADFVADPMGALYWPEERLLAVADLHLEKGSSYAVRRMFLPPYDTAMTLATLALLVTRYKPRAVVALGDSFHDVSGGDRLLARDRAALHLMQIGREWIWIAGNHDPVLPASLGGMRVLELSVGTISFRHYPQDNAGEAAISGHLHPVARVAGMTGSVRRRCFVSDGTLCILPAFGAYAGGLNLHDRAFAPFFLGREHFAHVIGRDRVYKVSHRQCLPD